MNTMGQGPPDIRPRTPWWDATCLVLVAWALGSGCDDVGAVVSDLSEELRGAEAAEGRAGTLRALEVSHRANRLAEAIGRQPSEDCTLTIPEGGGTYTLEVQIERERRWEAPVRWTETRKLRRDASGDLELEMRANYTDDLGVEGDVHAVWLVVEQWSYVGAARERLYRRKLEHGERARVLAFGPGTIQSLLDAVRPGWQPADAAQTWKLGTDPLRCARGLTTDSGWIRRLATRGEVVGAEFSANAQRRTLGVKWLLEDGVALNLEAQDSVEASALPVDAPDERDLIEVERQRQWKSVTDIRRRLIEEESVRPSEDGSGTEK